MKWYQQKPKETKDFDQLTKTYNQKYGSFDYAEDSRSLDTTFEKTLIQSVEDLSGLNVLVCGSNSGYEIGILAKLFPDAKFTAVDISSEALSRLAKTYLFVACFHANMEALPFGNKEFDLYINCRAIHSTDVDMEKAVEEAIRVTKGKVILSVSNGYRIDDHIVNGMYNYDSQKIDEEKSKKVANSLKTMFINKKYKVEELSSEAELFLILTPDPHTSDSLV